MMFFIGILLPFDNKQLLSNGSKTGASPLTISLANAGIAPAAHLINGLIVLSVISAGNSSLYVASRTLLYMGRNGKAPRILGRTNKAGVPWVGLCFSNVFACIAFLSVSGSAGKVYNALITLSGCRCQTQTYTLAPPPSLYLSCFDANLFLYHVVSTFVVWSAIGVTHIRFRKALVAQGQDPAALPYKAVLYPYGTYFSLAFNIFLIFFQGYPAFLNPFSAKDFVINYILLPVFVGFVVFWKFYKKTKIVKLEEMDIWTGRRDYASAGDDAVAIDIKKRGLGAKLRTIFIG